MTMSVSGRNPDFSEMLKIPSVTSFDPNERKLARRLRIQRRQEILSKRGAVEDEEMTEETPLENQIFASADVLEKLETEGGEVVTSVKIANDAREVQRRKEEREIKNKLLEKLEVENEECMKLYQKISDKWMSILACNDPLDIHTEMEFQNQKCLEVLSKKDAVIAELKQVLKEADLQYEEDQKKQNEDIDILIERIENQINVMSKAYCHELLLINSVIDTGCKALLTTVATRWESLYKKLRESSCEGIERRKEIMKEYEDELEKLMIQYQEEYRAQKIRLEFENQRVQQEVQYMKALCMLNTQKLDYSYSVLKLREDENSIIKGQQKRRINKLQDVINKLKKDYSELEESSRSQIQKLTDQVLKIHTNISELQNKSDHFTQVNDNKYLQVWDMNVKNARKLIDEILNADKQICKEILGLEWQPPQKVLLMKEDLPSYCDVMAKIKKDDEERKELLSSGRKSSQSPCRTNKDINLERNLLKHILKQISAQSGYLIEDSLREILIPYTGNDNIIIRLDNIFRALAITSEGDINHLLKFFLPYSFCPTCTAIKESKAETPPTTSLNSASSVELDILSGNIENKKEFKPEEIKLISAVKRELHNEGNQEGGDVCFTEESLQNSVLTSENSDNDVKSFSAQVSISSTVFDDDTSKQPQIVCERGHLLQIRTSYVTRALKEFVESYHSLVSDNITTFTKNKLLDNKTRACSRALTSADISKFWQSYRDIFPEKREKVWDALLVGLQKYYQVLKERQQLCNQIGNLSKQNRELRRLLKGCSVNVAQYYNSGDLH